MKLNNLFISSFVKTKLVLILLGILLSVISSSFIIYQVFGLVNTKQDVKKFKERIAGIVKVQNKKVNLKKELKEVTSSSNNQSSVLFSYDNGRNNTNPFRSLLAKKKIKSQLQSETGSIEKSTAKPQQSNFKPDKPKVRVLGILGNQKSKRAILKLGSAASEVYIVKANEQIKGLKVELITENKVIITKQNYNFSYEFGGQNYELKAE